MYPIETRTDIVVLFPVTAAVLATFLLDHSHPAGLRV